MDSSEHPATDFSHAVSMEDDRVRLEQLNVEHAAQLQEAVSDGELHKLWFTFVPAPENVAAEIQRRLDLQGTGSMAPWAVIDKQSGKVVGMSTFMNIDAANRRLEIGSTFLAASAQRTGINTGMKYLMLQRAFEELGCIAVEFRTHWMNMQSRAAITRLGAKQDGVLRSHQLLSDGSLRDTVVFSIIASEWPAVRNSLLMKK